MNFYARFCPGCGAFYQEVVEAFKSILLHPGSKSTQDNSELPTKDCIRFYKYVVFNPCGHCCPDIFGECRACELELPGFLKIPGTPSTDPCQCHYCIPKSTLSSSNLGSLEGEKTYKIVYSKDEKIQKVLENLFNLEELRALSFQLGIEFENLLGNNTRQSKSLELLNYSQRHGMKPELISRIKEARPHAQFEF